MRQPCPTETPNHPNNASMKIKLEPPGNKSDGAAPTTPPIESRPNAKSELLVRENHTPQSGTVTSEIPNTVTALIILAVPEDAPTSRRAVQPNAVPVSQRPRPHTGVGARFQEPFYTSAPRCQGLKVDDPPPEQHASIFWHLAKFAPLTMILRSVGKSLHGWYRMRDLCRVHDIYRYACLCGSDKGELLIDRGTYPREVIYGY